MAPNQQPSSAAPTSLLWAHKLQLEQGYLLQRMQHLENKNAERETRLVDAEKLAQTTIAAGVADLAKKVKAIDDAGVLRRVNDMERNVERKLDDAGAGAEVMKVQIAAVQEKQARADEGATGRDRELLRRIGEVEENLSRYEHSLEVMGKKIDEAKFEKIKGRLNSLAEEVKAQGEGMKFLTESIKAMEKSNVELGKAVGKNERELKRMAEKSSVHAGAQQDADALAENAQQPPQKKKKKSHKWSGGGADRDIIRQGSDLYGDSIAQQASTQCPHRSDPNPQKRPSPISQKKQRTPLAGRRSSNTPQQMDANVPKKSQQWSGGGADRGIIEAGMALAPNSRHEKSVGGSSLGNATAADATNIRSTIVLEKAPNEVVTRSGKGWYEIVDSEPQAPIVKRGRGRPRKANITPHFTQEGLKAGRSTRSTNYAARDDVAKPRKKHALNESSARQDLVSIKKEQTDDDDSFLAPEVLVADSIAAESEPVQELSTTDPQASRPAIRDAAGTKEAEPASSSPLPPPRLLVQDEDYETFMKRYG